MTGIGGENEEDVVAVVAGDGPWVFASPHSGDRYPDDLGAAPGLSRASLRAAEDVAVDRLIAPGAALGASLVIARVARAYVDLNRGEDELDAVLIDDVEAAEPSARVRAGYGVLPRLTGDGHPLYGRKLTAAEARARIERVHRPYHRALGARMAAARAAHGRTLLVDWHSMPSRAVGGARGPDVVLGDRHGASCEAAITRRARRAFEAAGLKVALNHPYAGGYATTTWGRPADGFQALQIELNRALYLDEKTLEPGPGWGRCAAAVEAVMRALTQDL